MSYSVDFNRFPDYNVQDSGFVPQADVMVLAREVVINQEYPALEFGFSQMQQDISINPQRLLDSIAYAADRYEPAEEELYVPAAIPVVVDDGITDAVERIQSASTDPRLIDALRLNPKTEQGKVFGSMVDDVISMAAGESVVQAADTLDELRIDLYLGDDTVTNR